MNKTNKIILSLILGVAINQVFAGEGKETVAPTSNTVQTEQAPLTSTDATNTLSKAAKNTKDELKDKASSYKEMLLKWKDAASYYAAGVFAGAFAIEHFKLTGNKAFFAKYGSLALTVAAGTFVAAKAYTYFFEEEVDEEEVF